MTPIRTTFLILFASFLAACGEGYDPDQNTPTTGELIVFVDEPYVPLVTALADSFMQQAPDARVRIEPAAARKAIEALLNTRVADTASGSDTTVSTAAVVGRALLDDEVEVYRSRQFVLMEYLLGWDGIAVVAAPGFSEGTTRDSLVRAVTTENRRGGLLGAADDEVIRLVMPGPSSSVYHAFTERYLDGAEIAGPVTYVGNLDSAVGLAAEARTISVINWSALSRAEVTATAIEVGYTDSTGTWRPPTEIHPSTLVTEAYPLKQPLYGYSFSLRNSLANGFLAWMARSQVAQETIANAGLQPANLKLRLIIEE